MADIYLLNIDRHLNKEEYFNLSCCIYSNKRERLSRFHYFEDSQRSLLGDVLARYAICKKLKTRNTDLTFDKNDYGKPILTKPTGIHFNISHSGNWVVCIIDDEPVGIDVEIIKPIDFTIAERFFTHSEYSELLQKEEDHRLKYFYNLWTLKESYVKAIGKGLSFPINSFSIKIQGDNILTDIRDGYKKPYFKQHHIDEDHVLAACAFSNNFANITLLNSKEYSLIYHSLF